MVILFKNLTINWLIIRRRIAACNDMTKSAHKNHFCYKNIFSKILVYLRTTCFQIAYQNFQKLRMVNDFLLKKRCKSLKMMTKYSVKALECRKAESESSFNNQL